MVKRSQRHAQNSATSHLQRLGRGPMIFMRRATFLYPRDCYLCNQHLDVKRLGPYSRQESGSCAIAVIAVIALVARPFRPMEPL